MARILLVDDNRDCSTSLAALLQFGDHEVTVANSGLAALAATAIEHFDLVLLDLLMPQMNGYETARRMRAQATGKPTRIVALTGYCPPQKSCDDELFDDYLLKPVELSQVEAVIYALPSG